MADNPQAGLKDRNLQGYYEALAETFGTPGWEFLMEDLQKLYDAAHTIEGINTMEELAFRRGQIDIIKLIVAQPAVAAAAYDALLEEDDGA
jgi:hypothetical protein